MRRPELATTLLFHGVTLGVSMLVPATSSHHRQQRANRHRRQVAGPACWVVVTEWRKAGAANAVLVKNLPQGHVGGCPQPGLRPHRLSS